ncbi:XRE family transcriptional regulator [Pseudoflavonifractor sp. HCP28S3_F10]|uniref:XRE family transcriptional regulator n=1 Tax=Pseudoflavonifractor sp. HCP28S3_F10 TaxID=3438947 RepID=UPI002A8491EB|nr:XRE family transcriptional regulator [Clostridiales bacterium]MDY4182613.1 XRE family transcriptional regulator [Pseudoflavonifractor sp.]
MQREQSCREAVLRQMKQMAKSRPNDVVKLAFLDEEQLGEIDKLDLMMLSELKRTGNGGVEVKLNDRLKTLERILELLDGGPEEKARALYQALENGAEQKDGA